MAKFLPNSIDLLGHENAPLKVTGFLLFNLPPLGEQSTTPSFLIIIVISNIPIFLNGLLTN